MPITHAPYHLFNNRLFKKTIIVSFGIGICLLASISYLKSNDFKIVTMQPVYSAGDPLPETLVSGVSAPAPLAMEHAVQNTRPVVTPPPFITSGNMPLANTQSYQMRIPVQKSFYQTQNSTPIVVQTPSAVQMPAVSANHAPVNITPASVPTRMPQNSYHMMGQNQVQPSTPDYYRAKIAENGPVLLKPTYYATQPPQGAMPDQRSEVTINPAFIR